ncbi:MAG: hypothetical protein LBU66_00735 [Treponema sp.]|jgi:hypothetical protein|nr:hypothetical protein [Treponema sp.]
MAKNARSSNILYFFALFWLLIAISPVYGGGSRDADLSKADELINQREYEQAMSILSDYARRNPDRFEDAQTRLQKIYQLREEFNITAIELINLLLHDPDNSEKILELTIRLRTLENENSPLLLNFVARTHEIARFNVMRTQLRNILERGKEFIDSGESEAAIQTYAGAMRFLRDEFYASGYGDEIENRVREETERINSVAASFRQASSQMGAISAELARAINSGQTAQQAALVAAQTRIPELISNLTLAMDGFIELKSRLYTADSVFNKILDEIRIDDPEIGDYNHLSILARVINGRLTESSGAPASSLTSARAQEGMLGAFDVYWNNSIDSVVNAIITQIETGNSAALTAFNSGNYTAAINALNNVENYFDLTPFFFDKHVELFESDNPHLVSIFGNTVLQEDIRSFLTIRSLYEAGNVLRQAAAVALREEIDRSTLTLWQQGNYSAAEAQAHEQQIKNSITAKQRDINAIKERANQIDAQINALHDNAQFSALNSGQDSSHNSGHIKNAITALDRLSSTLLAEERNSAQRYYTIALSELERILPERKAQLERARNLLDGERRTNPDGTVTLLRFPSEALQELTAMLSALSAELERGNAVLAQFRNEPSASMPSASVPSAITESPDISRLLGEYQGAVDELNSIRAQGLALNNTARSRSAQAETYRQEGERLFREAQTAFQRNNFEAARNAIQRASDRFNNSLEIQESASVRQYRDTQLVNLGQAIVIAENEMIITEVRNLVTNARVAYFAGNFQQAEDSLTRARNRWRVTNPEENEEVVYWISIVRGAMSARSGRIIPPTAPLFPEMSQLLSQARRNYEEGVRHINAGQRALGLAKFDEARMQTREVRLIFPVNQEAGILELRMEQYTDPTTFNASFEQRLRNAITGTRQRSIESFADLQNLAEINPSYPGIRNIINQAEIDMGYRPPPPNPANIARSRELTTAANRILEGNITAQYEVALTQINEAITLNPDNSEAARVKDRLLYRMSVPGAIVLSSQDEDEYQRAMREFQAGNNLVAMALVERLMQNPRNRNITKLIELQRRIQQSVL